MPEAPKLSKREFLLQAAENCLATVRGSLGDGVEPVPEIATLEKMIESEESDVSDEELSMAIYELMIERGMTYDEDPDTGILTPTNFNIQENLDVPEVQAEFGYLYNYGMNLISKGLVSTDNMKKIVTERLIARTGKTPEEFDAWLGY